MSTRPRVAFVAACCATLAAYALLRCGQRLAYGEADPALVIYSEHAAYFWRAWTASYFGAMTGAAVWLASARHEARIARVLPTAVLVATGSLAAQALLLP